MSTKLNKRLQKAPPTQITRANEMALMDLSSDRFWETDADLNVTKVSAAAGRMDLVSDRSNYRLLIGRPIWDRPGIDVDNQNWTELRAVMDAREPIKDFRYERDGAGGARHNFRINGYPNFEDDGAFTGYHGVTIDETIERRAQSESALASNRFLEAFGSVNEGVAFWDADDRFVYCNDFFREEHGDASDGLVLGRPFADFLDLLAERDPEISTEAKKQQWIEGQIAEFQNEPTSREKFRAGAWIVVRKILLKDGSKIAFYSNITAQKSFENALSWSEQLFGRIFDDVSTGMTITDAEGHFLRVNQAHADFLGYTKAELLELNVIDTTPSHDHQATKARRKAMFALQPSGAPLEREFLTKHGKIKWGLITRAIVKDEATGTSFLVGQIQDITDTKQAQAELRESEQRVNALLNASFDTAILIERDGTLVAMNASASKRLGRSEKELIGNSVFDYFSPELVEERAANYEKVFETGEAIRSLQLSNGRWVDASMHPVFGQDQRVSQIAVFTRDVTEQQEAENTRLYLEERLRDFAEASADRLWETDENYCLTYLSPAQPGSNQRPTQELLGDPLWTIRGIRIEGGDQATFRAKFESQEPFKNHIYRRDVGAGEIDWVRVSANPVFDKDGKFSGFRGSSLNVTREVEAEQRAAETQKRFLDAIDNAPMGVVYWDPDNRLGFANSRFKSMYSFGEDLLETDVKYHDFVAAVAERLDGLNNDADRREWIAEATESNPSQRRELEISFLGEARLIHQHQLADGSKIAFHSDISELKQREEALRQAQKMEAIGHLTGGVAHDFNNLLAAIMGNLELLGSLADDPVELRARIAKSIQVVNRGAVLTSRLLSFSRRQSLEAKPTNLNLLLYGMVDLLQRSLGENIQIDVRTEPSVHRVLIDRNQLENAILNLAVNARDAMPNSGSIKIECSNLDVSSEMAEKIACRPGRYVQIVVSDTGTGIAPELLNTVVEPFFTTKDVGAGSGLGLSMVDGFVSQSGGHLNIESVIGEGTRVSIYLPAIESEALESTVPKSTAPTLGDSLADSARIVLVEDDADVLDTTYEMLKALDLTVIACSNGVAVDVDDLAAMRPDILLTDVILPDGLRGWEIADRLKKKCPNLRVILVSGYAESDFDLDALEEKGYVFLPKPFLRQDLITNLNAVMAN